MSTFTEPTAYSAAPPASASPPAMSAVEYVRRLPVEAKGEVLFSLLRELIQEYGGRGLVPFHTAEGEFLGHYVPPAACKAQVEAALRDMPPAFREKVLHPLPDDFDFDDCLTDEELERIMRGESPRSP